MPAVERKEIANAAWYIQPFESGNGAENAAAAYEYGAGFGDRIKDMFTMPGAKAPKEYDRGNLAPSTYHNDKEDKANRKRTADNTKRMADKLDMTDAEIRELREAAVTPALAQWQQQNVVINVENNNNVASDIDIDGMTSDFVRGVREALSIQKEGAAI